jgi:polyhydroxyalkanoate synthesis regulator phasin
LGNDQGQEAQELRGQIDQINGEIQDVERQMAGIQRERAGMQRADPRIEAGGEGLRPRARQNFGEGQNPAGRLQELRTREDQIRDRLAQLGDQDREAAKGLEQELDRTRAAIEATQRSLQVNEAAEWRIQNDLAGSEGRRQQAGGEMVVRVYKLRYANAEQMQKIVSPLLTRIGKVSADARTGSLVVTDTPETHKRIESVLQELDVQASGAVQTSGTEVDELRGQVKGLQEQIRQMRAMLEEIASQKGKDKPEQQEMKQY